jgi:hypothetical protein
MIDVLQGFIIVKFVAHQKTAREGARILKLQVGEGAYLEDKLLIFMPINL